MSTPERLTADELAYVRIPLKRVELVKGVLLVREPAGGRHGRVTAELTRQLANHVAARGLGAVYGAETGFTLVRHPDTVRAPDVAFVRAERIPNPEPTGFPELAPDLVIEVLSPADRPGEILAKVTDWLSAGTAVVWVIDPDRRLARVYRADGSETLVAAEQVLEGEDVVPGFATHLGTVLESSSRV